MKSPRFFLLFLVVIEICTIVQLAKSLLAQNQCFSHENHPYLLFSLRSLYHDAWKAQGEPEHPEEKFKCEPIRAWLYVRHGARYPGNNTLPRMPQLENLVPKIIKNHQVHHRGHLSQEELRLLKKWRVDWTSSQARILAPRGEEDTFQLAVRLKKRFPEIFNKSYSEDLYKFYTSDDERSVKSAYVFGRGLFNTTVSFPTPVANDPICRPYTNCTVWNDSLLVPDIKKEEDLFLKGKEIKAVVEHVSTRLGFNQSLPLELIVKIMYDECRFRRSMHHGPSAWCAAFSKKDLQVIEYLMDLAAYYHLSYGNKLNLKLGCIPVKNMMEWIQRREETPIAEIFTTHSVMMMVFITSLGIAKENLPLLHDNYSEQKNRTFRSSFLDPGSANVVAVFFKCEESSRVLLLLNERPITFPECPDGMCPVSVLENKYDRQCPDLADWCNTKS